MTEIKKQFSAWKSYYKRFFPENRSTKILDIGCGNGGFLYFLQECGFKNIQGIDISSEQVKLAHSLGIKNVILADSKDFLLKKLEIYDMIFMRDCLEHFVKDEIPNILESIYNSLKHNGLLIIQTPNGESLFSGKLRYADFTHEVVFTRNSLSQVFKVIGFKEPRFYPTGPVPKGLISVLRCIVWKCIEFILRLYAAVETGSFSGIFTQNVIAVAKK